jgi:hypothetical protein
VTSGSSIAIVDVRNPGNPAAVGSYPATALGLAAVGGRLYVVNSSQLLILNVTNPAAPSLLSTSAGYGAQGVAIWGTYALLGAPADALHPENHGLYVVNVANPAVPTFVEQLVLAGNARSVVTAGEFAYVGNSGSVVDVVHLAP